MRAMPKEPGTYHRVPATRFSVARRLTHIDLFVVVESDDIIESDARLLAVSLIVAPPSSWGSSSVSLTSPSRNMRCHNSKATSEKTSLE